MIQIVTGQKGKGKTKYLIEKANESAKKGDGSIVYLDKSQKHMYELNNRIRLINVLEYPIENNKDLICFICGLLAADHDIDIIYLDSFLRLANLEQDDLTPALNKLESISEKCGVNFIISISKNENELPCNFKEKIIVSL
jgi:hypothetical protein